MKWEKLSSMGEQLQEYKWNFISEKEIPAVVEFWTLSYPELKGSPLDFIFELKKYKGKILIHEYYDSECYGRDYCMIRLKKNGEIMASIMLTKWDKNRQVELTIGATIPNNRKTSQLYLNYLLRYRTEEELRFYSPSSADCALIFSIQSHSSLTSGSRFHSSGRFVKFFPSFINR